MSNKLIVYYSRSGNTREAAKKLAENIDCEITEIISKKKFKGPFGWLSGGRMSMAEKTVDIIEPDLNPENYETLILCSPVWASNIPCPVRTWLNSNKGKYSRIAYLLTYSGGGAEKVLSKLTELGGAPINSVYFSDAERKNNVWIEKLKGFASKL
jgi:flavodoxin